MNDDELLADLLAAHTRVGRFEDGPALEAAFRVAASAHSAQVRDDGRPYITHPVRVARVLLEEWGHGELDLIQAALLHDVVEDTEVELSEIEEHFGPKVALLVDHLTKPERGEGESKTDRDERYYARLAQGPAGAKLAKLADRLDNVRDMLQANWSEAKKSAYCVSGLEKIAPLAESAWPEETAVFREVVEDVKAAILRGEGDVPDVGPHEDYVAAGADPDDRTFVLSPRLSFFARANGEGYLFHDLIGDIIQLHEKVIPFLDYFREAHLESEAREAFANEFLPGDFDAFFETLSKHLVLLTDREEDTRTTRDWYPIHGPWIVSHAPPTGQVILCYRDRRSDEIVEETLSPLLGDLWRLCDGGLTTGELVRRLARIHADHPKVDASVRDAVRRWTHSERQLLKLIPRPRSAYEVPGSGLPPYSQSTMPYPRVRAGEAPPEPVDLRHYHRVEIDDASEQFEVKETTLSHALRTRHEALADRSYGEAFLQSLLARDLIPLEGPPPGQSRYRAVEVGGGVGFFGAALLDALALRAPRLFNRLRYTIVDLSPELSRSQRERLARHGTQARFVTGEAERLPLADASVDLLVSNEVIADLRVLPTRRQDVEGEGAEGGGEGAELLRRYGASVADAPGLFYANVGAIRFVEEIARVLRPGGVAILTEYGEIDRYPAESSHLDHPEFSIHFGHLDSAARGCGLSVEVESLPRFLELRGEVSVLQTTQTFFLTLRAFLGTRGIALEKLAYTPESFAKLLAGKLDPAHLQGLRFGPAGKRVLGLKPLEFKALILRRPKEERPARKSIELDL
ncbi:MAG: SAM-dependent methyltransferase [Planctomycetes bacterium]|nr:SAM-dependent methyltransferase [Planctomycetota bacterium]